MAACRKTSKCISIGETIMLQGGWINTRFLSTTKASFEAKIDKETCGKVIEAAKTVKDGVTDVAKEARRVGEVVTKKAYNTTEDVVVNVAEKGFEKASKNVESQNNKDVLDTVKAVTEAFKEKAIHHK